MKLKLDFTNYLRLLLRNNSKFTSKASLRLLRSNNPRLTFGQSFWPLLVKLAAGLFY